MKEIRLLIARHGETDYNKDGLLQGRGIDAPLNATGMSQATELAKYIEQYPVTYIGSSSMIRAYETAEYYADDTDMNIIQHAGLDEMDFGEFEGKPYAEVVEELEPIDKAWRNGEVRLQLPGGESPAEVFERANEVFQSLLSEAEGSHLFVVAHGRLLRILLSEWLGYGIKNMDRIHHDNCGVNQIIWSDGEFRAEYLNKTNYFNKLKRFA